MNYTEQIMFLILEELRKITKLLEKEGEEE